MKIYWTKKSIPELTEFSAEQRKSNNQEAAWLARAHREFWAGAAVFALMIILLTYLFSIAFPGTSTFARDAMRATVTIPPSILVLNQFLIYSMRNITGIS